MIRAIVGDPGVGKTSLNMYFLKMEFLLQGKALYEACCNRINILNVGRKNPLTLPDRAPIFSDFKAIVKYGYNKQYESYYINGFYFGLKNERLKTLNLPPYAKIHLCECQKYFDSRKAKTFPAFVSRAFEMHRHYGLEITLDAQRLGLIDLNVREICGQYIEVIKSEHEYDEYDRICKTTWYCREFNSYRAIREYYESGGSDYKETMYVNEGNIFDMYDSYGCFEEFVPDDGQDFDYLEHLRGNDVKKLPEEVQRYYNSSEPKEYRTEPKPEKDKKK